MQRSADQGQDIFRCRWDIGARPKYCGNATGLQQVMVLLRDNPAANNHDIVAALRLKLRRQFRHQTAMGAGMGGNTDRMNAAGNGPSGRFRWAGEQRLNINIKTHIGESRCNNFGTAIMAVLPELGDQHFWPVAILFCKDFNFAAGGAKFVAVLGAGAINTGDGLNGGDVAGEHIF